MNLPFDHLTVLQVEELFNAPVWVAFLIAGVDGVVDAAEHSRAAELVHIKSFSEKADLVDFYKALEPEFELRFMKAATALPSLRDERNKQLVEKLSKLNEVLDLLPYRFALHYYKSLRNYAVHIANAAGGLAGLFQISEAEKEYLHLSMLHEPTHHTE